MANYYGDMMRLFQDASAKYKKGISCTKDLGDLGHIALEIVSASGVVEMPQGSLNLNGQIKQYSVRRWSNNLSRPIRTDLLEKDPNTFGLGWSEMVASFDHANAVATYQSVDRIIYTCLMSFAVAVDLHSPGSRKTPGTFFEMLMGSLLADLTGLERFNQIEIPYHQERVTTDVYLPGGEGRANLVVATKTTTRERIVQVWAHQRILDNIYGRGKYRSILIAASELRRDDKKTAVQEICVPGQVKLYQKHLAQLHGIYYLDLPAVYASSSFTSIVPVFSLQTLFSSHLNALLSNEVQ